MIFKLAVPAAVPGVEEIRVLEWHLEEGSPMVAGDLVVELETHKAVVEVRAGRQGILRSILAQAGEWRAIGVPLAVVSSEADEELPSQAELASAMPVEFEVT